MKIWDKADSSEKPIAETFRTFINNPLWDDLCNHIETEYQSKPVFEYSKCSGQPGWNMKYKKAGRSLCTIYPMEGYFIALVVIGEAEREKTELMLPFCSEYFQKLYHSTKALMNQKWLMINVLDAAILEDVKHCIAIRREYKKVKQR
jgi:AraC family transcriptional regulator